MLADSILQEFRNEAPATRRLLERVPDDRLAWRPHAKSRTLGELATHVARLPGLAARIIDADEFTPNPGSSNQPASAQTICAVFDESAALFTDRVGQLTDQAAQANWRMVLGGKELFRTTRIQALRANVLNHLYHHRGQLTVYLRLLDVPLPSVYGPTADENPFLPG